MSERAIDKRLRERLAESGVKGLKNVEEPKIIAAPERIEITKGARQNNYPKPQPFVAKVYEGAACVATVEFNRTRSLHQTLADRLWRQAFKLAKQHRDSDVVVIYAGENGVNYEYPGEESVIAGEGEQVVRYRTSLLLSAEWV